VRQPEFTLGGKPLKFDVSSHLGTEGEEENNEEIEDDCREQVAIAMNWNARRMDGCSRAPYPSHGPARGPTPGERRRNTNVSSNDEN